MRRRRGRRAGGRAPAHGGDRRAPGRAGRGPGGPEGRRAGGRRRAGRPARRSAGARRCAGGQRGLGDAGRRGPRLPARGASGEATLSLPELCLRRPVATVTGAIAALVLGLVSVGRLPLEYLPEIEGRSLNVSVGYTASAPEEVERVIARPLEEELASLPGLRAIDSSSTASGAQVRLELEPNADVDAAALEVRERIDRARAALPADVGQIEVRRWRSSDRPVFRFRVAPAPGTSHRALERFVDEVLVARLGRAPGVGNVEVQGLARRRVLVEVDRERLAQVGLTPADVARLLRLRNRNVSAGRLQAGGRVLSVRVLGELGSAEAVAALPLGIGDATLGDVALVREELTPLTVVERLDGRDAITVRVSKESGANSVEVCRAVAAELERILALPNAEGFLVEVFSDDAERILARLGNLVLSGLYGGGLLCVVLLLFLRRLASTVVVALTIPCSVVLTFALLYGLRTLGVPVTLNVVSLMGLILGVGLVVDNGIVVLENIVRLREEGLDAARAAARGASEVSQAITASVATSLIVFVPLLLGQVGGMMGGRWMRDLALVVCASVFSSLWVALTLVPLLASRLRAPPPSRKRRSGSRSRFRALLAFTLRWRWPVLALVLPLCSAQIVYFFRTVERSWGGGESTREIDVRVDIPRAYGPAQRRELFARLERIFLDPTHRRELDLEHLTTTFRTSAEAEPRRRRRHFGGGGDSLELVLRDDGPGERVPLAVARRRVRELLPQIPGVVFHLGASRRMGGGGRSLSVEVVGRDAGELLGPAERVRAVLAALPGIDDAALGQEGSVGLELLPRRRWAARFDVAPRELGRAVAASLSERAVTRLRAGTQELEVILRLAEEDRSSLDQLLRTPVPTQTGALPLASLAALRRRPAPREIRRSDRRAVVAVTASVSEDAEVRTVARRVERALTGLSLPRGISWRLDRSARRWRRDEAKSSGAALLALALVLMLLAALFESVLEALVVAVTVPFALVGVAWAFWATGTHLDTTAWVGLLILMGIVVNHGIVLLDRVRRLLDGRAAASAFAARRALLRAGCDRLRPIVMTAATTVLGLLPIVAQHLFPEAFSADSGAQTYGPIGLAVASGLAVSTALTLLVLPATTSLALDARRLWKERFAQ
ncbi:MAG: efflux RND transporter permease subunit [Planctomycetota bacterium]|nr:MAG: efflux RND transporter permease subunit [Planctomycetota bacterium]